jgi:hypothetical protein
MEKIDSTQRDQIMDINENINIYIHRDHDKFIQVRKSEIRNNCFFGTAVTLVATKYSPDYAHTEGYTLLVEHSSHQEPQLGPQSYLTNRAA